MSIATLKRKSQSTYKVNSGKPSGNTFVINMRGPVDCSSGALTDSGVGFSLNGQHRNRSYIGKSYAVSNRPGQAGHYCCADTSHTIKPSVTSSKAVMNNNKLWTKRPFTTAELGGNIPPTHNRLQYIYNNWVQTGINGGVLGSSSNIANSYDHFYERKNQVANCKTDFATSNDNIYTANCDNSACRRVLPYTKSNNMIIPSSKYNVLYKARRAGNGVTGYSKPFPFTSPLPGCKPIYKQANEVLTTYYNDANGLLSSCGGTTITNS